MDRRILKTRRAIFDAFENLMSKKAYSKITIQDILDEANIGRSTFYAHFETKDDLLEVMCKELFEHIFSDNLKKEKYRDYSNAQIMYADCSFEACAKGECGHGLGIRIEHICRHLYEQKDKLCRIMSCESRDIYLKYFSDNLHRLFDGSVVASHNDIPEDFTVHHLTEGFVSAIKWWVDEKMATPPETLAGYFCRINYLCD